MPRNNRNRPSLSMVILLVIALGVYYVTNARKSTPGTAEPEDPSPPAPSAPAGSAVRLVTWNLLNLGRSKSDPEIAFIAGVLHTYDVVAVQEVSTGPAGAQAVARLVDALERRGADWDYTLSDPTVGPGSERYAFLWKPSRLRLQGQAWLEASLASAVDREPYLARFTAGDRTFLLASFHAVPRDKNPDAEITRLDDLERRYPDDNLLVMGDFNLSQKDKAFDELKGEGLRPALVDQKTSLRMKAKASGEPDAHLANEYDNIFFETDALRAEAAGVIDFSSEFPTLEEARAISDHLPVYLHVGWN